MDFVGNDGDVVRKADVGHCSQFFSRPDASDRVGRVAEDEETDFFLDDLAFEVVEVDGIAAVAQDKFVIDELAMVVTDRRGKRIIDRRLDHDGVACPGQRADGGTDGEDDARRFDEPFFLTSQWCRRENQLCTASK